MSKPWKGIGFAHEFGDERTRWVTDNPDDAAPHKEQHPVIVQPIEDESLPHPGDGREWERRSWAGSDVWHKVNILAPPVHDSDGSPWVLIRYVKDGDTDLVEESTLRERKPKPRHRPWCAQRKHANAMYACTCERRSGEDRREGERRSLNEPEPNYVATAVRNALLSGRRSGKDRRESP